MQHPDFKVKTLPLKDLNYDKIMDSVVLANREIWKYYWLVQTIQNPGVLLWIFTTIEAVSSLHIDWIQTSILEVIKHQDSINNEDQKFEDIQEVLNYKKALLFAFDKIEDEDISLPLLKDIHSILLDWSKWENKEKWEFRTIQNWIWSSDSTPETASYLPPSPKELDKHLKNLEDYFKYDDRDPLVQAAIIHAQFDNIYPFLNWNRRMGRLLIPLFLYKKWLLSYPCFFMSEYFDYDKYPYINALRKVTHELNRELWIEYFMYAIVAQVRYNTQRIKDMQSLYEDMNNSLYWVIHTPQYVKILDFLFKKPVFTVAEFIENTWISKTMSYEYLWKLKHKWFLQLDEKSSVKTYIFKFLMDIIEN